MDFLDPYMNTLVPVIVVSIFICIPYVMYLKGRRSGQLAAKLAYLAAVIIPFAALFVAIYWPRSAEIIPNKITDLLFCATISIVFVLMGAFVWQQAKTKRRLRAILQQLEVSFRGRLSERSYPVLEIPLAGTSMVAEVAYFIERSSGDNVYYTNFSITSVNHPLQLLIYSEEPHHLIAKLLGLQDIASGDPEFDREFIIRADQEGLAAGYVGQPEVRQCLLEIKRLKPSPCVELRLYKEGFSIKKREFLDDIEDTRTFITNSLLLFEKLPKA